MRQRSAIASLGIMALVLALTASATTAAPQTVEGDVVTLENQVVRVRINTPGGDERPAPKKGEEAIATAAPLPLAAARARITSYYSPNETWSIAASDHEVWWGTGGGAFRLDLKTGERRFYSQPRRTKAIARDASGVWWFGTEHGAWSFDGRTWKNYTTKDGLANNRVWAIAFDGERRKWFGTLTGGVSCFDGKTWRTWTMDDRLAADHVVSLAVDLDGSIWVGTQTGVSHIVLEPKD